MAVKGSGALSFDTDIVGEFKGSRPHSLSEYYAGGTLVPAGTKNAAGNVIPSAGAIKFSDFYGATAMVVVNVPAASIPAAGSALIINNIPANAGKVRVNVPLPAVHTGGQGPSPGGHCNGADAKPGLPGMEITIPAGTQVVLYLEKDVIGGGGQGGDGWGGCHQGPWPGNHGGPGILVHGAPGSLTIDPSSPGRAIGGGGGGAGGGGGGGGSGAGGGGGAPFGPGGGSGSGNAGRNPAWDGHAGGATVGGGSGGSSDWGPNGGTGGNIGDAASGWNGYPGTGGGTGNGAGGLAIQYV